jgi:hypothetical protein
MKKVAVSQAYERRPSRVTLSSSMGTMRRQVLRLPDPIYSLPNVTTYTIRGKWQNHATDGDFASRYERALDLLRYSVHVKLGNLKMQHGGPSRLDRGTMSIHWSTVCILTRTIVLISMNLLSDSLQPRYKMKLWKLRRTRKVGQICNLAKSGCECCHVYMITTEDDDSSGSTPWCSGDDDVAGLLLSVMHFSSPLNDLGVRICRCQMTNSLTASYVSGNWQLIQ